MISLYFGGVITYVFEENYIHFRYPPYDIKDIRGLVDKIESYEAKEYGKFGVHMSDNEMQARKFSGFEAIAKAVDQLKANGDVGSKVNPLSQFKGLDFLIDANQSCAEQWKLESSQINPLSNRTSSQHSLDRDFVSILVIVKSAVNYFERRESIRKTWYLNGNIGSYKFKTVFFVGACDQINPVPAKLLQTKGFSHWTPAHCRDEIAKESKLFGDIIQSSGIDSYYNNTVKTFMTLRWIHERCPTDFALAIDDDYVVEIDNFLDYVATIAGEYLPSKIATPSSQDATHQSTDPLSTDNYTIALQRLGRQYFWSGYLLDHVKPLRSPFSKWYISRTDYCYDRYPTYLTGGMHLMSSKTARHLYYGTYFTQKFIFDDVYLGIIADRIHIEPESNPEFKCTIEYYLSQKPFRPNATRCSGVHDIPAKSLLKLWEIRRQISNGAIIDDYDFDALLV